MWRKKEKPAEPESPYEICHFNGDIVVDWKNPHPPMRHYFGDSDLVEPTEQEFSAAQKKARQFWDAQNQERSRVRHLPFSVSKNLAFSGFSNKGVNRYSRDTLEEEFWGGTEKPHGWLEKAIQIRIEI